MLESVGHTLLVTGRITGGICSRNAFKKVVKPVFLAVSSVEFDRIGNSGRQIRGGVVRSRADKC